MKRARPCLALLAVAACGSQASYELEPYDMPTVGRAPVCLGDIDGDGCADLALAGTFRPGDGEHEFVVWIVSGRTGDARFGLRVQADVDAATARCRVSPSSTATSSSTASAPRATSTAMDAATCACNPIAISPGETGGGSLTGIRSRCIRAATGVCSTASTADWLAHTYAAQTPMYTPACAHARR